MRSATCACATFDVATKSGLLRPEELQRSRSGGFIELISPEKGMRRVSTCIVEMLEGHTSKNSARSSKFSKSGGSAGGYSNLPQTPHFSEHISLTYIF